MKERPILFSGAMIRAIRDGRKRQTRRVVKPTQSTPKVLPLHMEPWVIDGEQQTDDHGLPCWAGFHPEYPGEAKWFSCPYGQPGDRLWVKETWHPFGIGTSPNWISDRVIYRADNEGVQPFDGCTSWPLPAPVVWAGKQSSAWKPSIFMPRWACRTVLDVVSVRVERVQDITHEDAVAEGCYEVEGRSWGRLGFSQLWDTINGKRGYGWDSNPWVWVVTFPEVRP